MERPEMQNAIRVNIRGFLPSSSKSFVLCDNKTGSDEFTVTLIHGEFVEHTVVFSGKMTTEIDEFGENTVLLRQIPMDLGTEQAAETLTQMAADLLNGRRESKLNVRDEILHTVSCKAAIKAGWHSNEKELRVLVEQVMARDDLKHCPHGRPICITLSKKQLEKQFKRS